MNNEEFEQIGSFRVHKSIISGLTGWEPYYWNFLTLESRNRVKLSTVDGFRLNLETYSECNVDNCHPEYINYLILRAANNSMGNYRRNCIYEHQKRVSEIQEGRTGRCGAEKKDGQQCLAKAIQGAGRCRHHGGKSTGPKTIDGKIKSLSKLAQYRHHPELLIEKRQQLVAKTKKETGF